MSNPRLVMFESKDEMPPRGEYVYAPRPLYGLPANALFPMLPWVGIVDETGLDPRLVAENRALDATPLLPVFIDDALALLLEIVRAEYGADVADGLSQSDLRDLLQSWEPNLVDLLTPSQRNA